MDASTKTRYKKCPTIMRGGRKVFFIISICFLVGTAMILYMMSMMRKKEEASSSASLLEENENLRQQQQQSPPLDSANNKPDTTTTSKTSKSLRQVFGKIYENKYWGDFGKGSGFGSEMHYMKDTIDLMFDTMFVKYNISNLIDASCGGMNWQPVLLEKMEKKNPKQFKFIGMDVVPSVIEAHVKYFKNKSKYRFYVNDLTLNASLALFATFEEFDAVLIRDTLQHLSFASAVKALVHLSKINARFLIVGAYTFHLLNYNIKDGAYSPYNIDRHPFFLEPLELYEESFKERAQKHLAVVSMDSLRKRVDNFYVQFLSEL